MKNGCRATEAADPGARRPGAAAGFGGLAGAAQSAAREAPQTAVERVLGPCPAV